MAENKSSAIKLIKILRRALIGNYRMAAKTQVSLNQSASNIFFNNPNDYIKTMNYSYYQNMYSPMDRYSRYNDFDMMDDLPEIHTALNVYADNTTVMNEYDKVLEISSDNDAILESLENLFYSRLDVDGNLWSWARSLCKYGDLFQYIDVQENIGVTSLFNLPIQAIEREEGYDGDPRSVRFKLTPYSAFSSTNQYMSNFSNSRNGETYYDYFQIAHFRLLGDDRYLPYSRSVLDAGRRIYKQLLMIEDAMMIYRIARAPERRLYKINVGGIPQKDIDGFIKKVISNIKNTNVIEEATGKLDLKYAPMSITDDIWMPVRGAQDGSDVTNLPGGENTAAIDDVKYIQKKLMMSLGVPRSFLGDEEGLNGKASLASEDYQFGRTIQRIQRSLVKELNKVAIIHLIAEGYDEEEVENFELKLANPSYLIDNQKIEALQARVNLIQSMVEGNYMDRKTATIEFLNYSEEKYSEIRENLLEDAKFMAILEKVKAGEDPNPAPEDEEQGDEFDAEMGSAEEDAPVEADEPTTPEDNPIGTDNPPADSGNAPKTMPDSTKPEDKKVKKGLKKDGKIMKKNKLTRIDNPHRSVVYNPLKPLDFGNISSMKLPSESKILGEIVDMDDELALMESMPFTEISEDIISLSNTKKIYDNFSKHKLVEQLKNRFKNEFTDKDEKEIL